MFDEYRFNKQAAFDGMNKRGIAKIELEFSGGHDEGGIDVMTAYDKDGNTVELPEKKYYVATQYSNEGTKRVFYERGDFLTARPLAEMPVEDRELHDFLENVENIVYSRYYSFAGDFYVYGTATIDAVNKTATIDGQETVEQYESFSQEF